MGDMRRHHPFAAALLLIMALVLAQPVIEARQGAGSSRPQQSSERPAQPPLPFWKDPSVVKEIGLTSEQVSKIDKLWRDRFKEMAGRVEELNKQQIQLEQLLMGRSVDPDVVALQIDRVEAQRTILHKSRSVLLYRMSLVLSPDQNKSIEAIWKRLYGISSDRGRAGSRGGKGRGRD